MRRGFGLIGLVVTVIVVAIVGVIAYQAGWSEGFAQHVPQGTANGGPIVNYPYYYGPHFFGFGWIFGLLFFLFFLWLVFRLAFWGFGGRRWGGYGGSRMYGGGMPHHLDERMREWHRHEHGEQPSAPGTPGSPPPPPPPDQRSV
jgi:hypothetical protein